MIDFRYDPGTGMSCEAWYKCNEDNFTVELANRNDKAKVRVLFHKLGATEHVRYTNFILPTEPQSSLRRPTP